MPFDYAKDNMERRPYEFYIEEYRKADPIEISKQAGNNRTYYGYSWGCAGSYG